MVGEFDFMLVVRVLKVGHASVPFFLDTLSPRDAFLVPRPDLSKPEEDSLSAGATVGNE